MAGGFRWSVLKSYDELLYLNKQVSVYVTILQLFFIYCYHVYFYYHHSYNCWLYSPPLSLFLSFYSPFLSLSLSLVLLPSLSLSLSQLVEEFAIDKSLFPQRKMFGSHKKEQIVELQSRLSVYLGTLLLQFSLPPVVLLRFLDYKFSVSNRTHFILKLLGCIYLMLCVCVCVQ